MKSNFIVCLVAVLTLGACTTEWSDTGKNGMPFEAAWQQGPADFPPDSRHDIEQRETSLCLMNNGFTRERKK